MLKGKHIVLGICGGIAAYKSVTLLRNFIKKGAEVQVVITPAGKEFITPVTLSALSGKPVICDFFSANSGEWHSHVDIGLWADAMVIAPATASSIAKMANGVADNMLITTYLSAKAPVFIAPAMDLDMMAHPSTLRNIELLRSYGNHIIEPASGELASHLIGKGRMEEPDNITRIVEQYFAESSSLEGKKVLVTAGPTYEKIDPVRFIGNYSSGKMGYAIAEEAARRGANVTLVSGPVSITCSEPAVKVVSVESAKQMLDACKQSFHQTDIAVMCAAVADYAPANPLDSKIKREARADAPTLELVKNPDIAATLGAEKKPGQILVGFALETDNEFSNALQKLKRKNLDMIVLNSLKKSGTCFNSNNNSVAFITPDNLSADFMPVKNKNAVAVDLWNEISKLKPES